MQLVFCFYFREKGQYYSILNKYITKLSQNFKYRD